MSSKQTRSNNPVGIHKLSSPVKNYDDPLAGILSDILKTREIRQLLITAVPEFLNVWAQNSFWKKTVSKAAGLGVKKQLSRPDDIFENSELAAVFEDKEFIKSLGKIFPDLLNQVSDISFSVFQSLDRLSREEKVDLFQNILTRTGKGRTGAILTSAARILNDIHTSHPQFLADIVEPGFRKWLESADFGEFKEALDDSEQGILALARVLNDTIWQYPSKVIGIFSFLPSLANSTSGVANITIEKLNAVPPDLLTDIIIALLKELNGQQVAVLVNELTEIVRKLSVGSALLGEPGSPQLPTALSEKFDEIVSQVDPVVFWKGKLALFQLKAVFSDALSEAAGNRPEFIRLQMLKSPEISNIRNRSKNKKLAQLESLDDEELSKLVGGRLLAYDVQEVAEAFNNSIRIFNRFLEQDSEVFGKVAGELLNALDLDELAFTAQKILEKPSEELKPVARSFVPDMVAWMCDILEPEDDEFEENASRARKALGKIFVSEEA